MSEKPQDTEDTEKDVREELDRERYEVLEQLDEWLEGPVLVLGFVWLVLLVVEFIWGLTPFLEVLVYVIWGIFVLDFAVRFVLAPRKLEYLKRNWLTALSLLVPALRVFRIFRVLRLVRVAQATRGLRLVRVVSSLNRGMRALRTSMGRRGFGYVLALTLVVVLVGAAGMFAFESDLPGDEGFENYGDALWWTAMILTTLGSQYWPRTAEGRVLGFLLSLYSFGVFGYVTATLSTFFIGREAESEESELAGVKSVRALQAEIAALRTEIAALSGQKSDR